MVQLGAFCGGGEIERLRITWLERTPIRLRDVLPVADEEDVARL